MHLSSLNVILADTTAAPTAPATGQQPQPPGFGNMIFLFAIMAIMLYFLMIRPQQLQRKKQQRLLAGLKSGDRVATAAGIVGTVITVKDTTVSLRSADAKMEVTKDSVTQILESAKSDNSTAS